MTTRDEAWKIDNADGTPTFLFAHGAGAPYDTPFMNTIAEGVAAAGLRVVRFEFPYMRKRREDGKRRGPNTAKVLEQTWREVIAAHATAPVFIGGKSMGGRIASMLADDVSAAGLICLGYPFHPSGKPGRLRVAHLQSIRTPALIVQGTRDPMGTQQEVEGYSLSKSITVRWLEDGDHSFKPRKRSGLTQEQHLTAAVEHMITFMRNTFMRNTVE